MVGAQSTLDTLIDRQRQEPPDLVGQDERLPVLREGDESHRPHRVPPSHPLQAPSAGAFQSQYDNRSWKDARRADKKLIRDVR
ncbi:hypothetical protein GCM10018962_16950 [Dactylosporangium matsuzakiense]|uniref:Uncharacterized protein n=1 Tax=Dactylosporangium matsuzakiense TaxID=53360 RepID=A0A9W6KJ08_9ACTN|nr:hypothetical protein GCM10017581_036090 [Dactylosporangium matsuzakiense]